MQYTTQRQACTHTHQVTRHVNRGAKRSQTATPVCFEVVLQVCRPGERAVAVLIGTPEHLLCVSTVTVRRLLLLWSLRLVAMEMLT